jgi:hypothetical protein
MAYLIEHLEFQVSHPLYFNRMSTQYGMVGTQDKSMFIEECGYDILDSI